MRRGLRGGVALLCLAILASVAHGEDSLRIQDAMGKPGSMVKIPVRLDTAQRVGGVQARFLFDAAVLESPGAEHGNMSSEDVFLDVSSSEPGVLSVVLCAGSGQEALAQLSGIVFSLVFKVKGSAAIGTLTTIAFDDPLPAPFSLSGTSISTDAGVEVSHTRRNGLFEVGSPLSAANWMLYE